jgi:hypothetical protein
VIELFQDGEQASASRLSAAFEELRIRGQQILDELDMARLEMLVTFEQYLSALNAKRQRADRLMPSNVLGRFLVSNFESIQQSASTATVRADTGSATLRERGNPEQATVRSTKFSASAGVVEQAGQMYRVYSETGPPTGTFLIEFAGERMINLLVLDTVSLVSDPTISVSASQDGVVYTEARSVSRNGYRINAWLSPATVRYVRVAITPTHPDTLGGSTYTFGITDLYSRSTLFHLRSDLVFKPSVIRPETAALRLRADAVDGLSYYMSFDNVSYFEVLPDDKIAVPDAEETSVLGVGLGANGLLDYTLPENVYLATLRIISDNGSPVLLAPDLADSYVPQSGPYITVNDSSLRLQPYDASKQSGLKFDLSYVTGPAELTVWLRVRLSSSDSGSTPVFRSAYLETA